MLLFSVVSLCFVDSIVEMQLLACRYNLILDHFGHHFWITWDFAVHSVSDHFWHQLSGHSQLQESQWPAIKIQPQTATASHAGR